MTSKRWAVAVVSVMTVLLVLGWFMRTWETVVGEIVEVDCRDLTEEACAALIADTVTPQGDRVFVTAGTIGQLSDGSRIVQFAVQMPVQISELAQDVREQQNFGAEFRETVGWILRLVGEEMLWDKQIVRVTFLVAYPWGEQQVISVPTWSLEGLVDRAEKDLNLWYEQFVLAVRDEERRTESEDLEEAQLIQELRARMGLPPRTFVKIVSEVSEQEEGASS